MCASSENGEGGLMVRTCEGDGVGLKRFSSPAPRLMRLSTLFLSELLRTVGVAGVKTVDADGGTVTVPPLAWVISECASEL